MRDTGAHQVIPYPQSEVQGILLATLAECDGLSPSSLVAEATIQGGRASRLAIGVQ